MTVVAVSALVLVLVLAAILLVRERDRDRWAADLLDQVGAERIQLVDRIQRPDVLPPTREHAPARVPSADPGDVEQLAQVGSVAPPTFDPVTWDDDDYDEDED